MASKLQKISELANQTAQAVTRDANGWMAYLDTAPGSTNTPLMNSS